MKLVHKTSLLSKSVVRKLESLVVKFSIEAFHLSLDACKKLLRHELYIEEIEAFHFCYFYIMMIWLHGKGSGERFLKPSLHRSWVGFT